MPFFRGLIFILAVWLAFVLARQLYRSHLRKRATTQQTPDKQLAVTVIPCEYCGVHIPKSEAVTANGHYFCSDNHKNIQD